MADTRVYAPANCLGQTCLTWLSDGELSPEDRQLVLERCFWLMGALRRPESVGCSASHLPWRRDTSHDPEIQG
jgi:hypothetical protein